MSELNPCPFCGATPELIIPKNILEETKFVKCECGVCGPHDFSRVRAILRWNKRLAFEDTITQLRRENEIMKKALEYIAMPHNEFQNKLNDSVEIMSELANQRLFDITEAKKALKDCEELK